MPTFTLFPELPTEIRLMVWANALPGSRVIPINLSVKHHRITNCTSPVLLRVSQESRNLALTLYFQSFTTTQYPHGIFICPTIDIILLGKPCSASPIHECDDCTNFELGPRLQRYNKTDLVQTIAFHESKLLGIEREAYKNMCYIHKTFRAIKNIVVRADCDLDEFRHFRGGIEDQIQDLSQLQEVKQQMQRYRQWDWEEAMDFYFPSLPPEDRRRRWQSFIELSAEGQSEHLQRLFDLGISDDSI
ncbi:hypothetical protein O988_02690 [Pseudogymnoascus sp. VKM F-3808]|nr:hypothetical protein O988_02690 [Pseudogymnoascus sp. VKM F-3808]